MIRSTLISLTIFTVAACGGVGGGTPSSATQTTTDDADKGPSEAGTAPLENVVGANGSQSPFLSFPLEYGDVDHIFKYSMGAYTPSSINSVLDHQMSTVYAKDGTVTAYTGESGKTTNIYLQNYPAPCYPKVSDGSLDSIKPFSVNGLYKGTITQNIIEKPYEDCSPEHALNYDGHAGYDYVAEIGTPVKAAAAGTVVHVKNLKTGTFDICVPKGIDPEGCSEWGFVGIDHGNGYVTQYGHLSHIYVVAGQVIREDQLGIPIGLSGQKSPGNKVGPHLHVEVLKLNQGASYGYSVVDPYGWESTDQNDPLSQITKIKNVRLWK